MDTEKIKRLLEQFFKGETTLEEEQKLREYFRSEEIPEELVPYSESFRYLERLGEMETKLTEQQMFAKIEDDDRTVPEESKKRNSGVLTWPMRIAAGIILVLVGFSAGLLLNQQAASEEELAALHKEVQEIKNALMYGQHQKASASERISAVRLSGQLAVDQQQDEEITEILIYTMNNDQNVNVRLAAAEALFRFRDEEKVREALVNSLPRQEEPLMQITLIDMLVSLKEKAAINEMQKMLMRSQTPDVVKERLQEGIAELKT